MKRQITSPNKGSLTPRKNFLKKSSTNPGKNKNEE